MVCQSALSYNLPTVGACNGKILAVQDVFLKEGVQDTLVTPWMSALLHLELASRCMPGKFPEADYLLAPILLIITMQFQAFQLVFERNRYFHHFDAPTS